jgi:hypothetical protein
VSNDGSIFLESENAINGSWQTISLENTDIDFSDQIKVIKISFSNMVSGDVIYINNIKYYDKIGNVLDLQPDAVSPVVWKDRSGNDHDAEGHNNPEVITTHPLPRTIASNDKQVVVGYKGNSDIVKSGGIVILESEDD